jgi:hypothetical protein
MSITRLQQARQMYAVGQLVSKTLDGSRPGYRGEGEYQGGTSSSSGKSGKTGGDRPNPHTASGTSKTSTSGPKSYDGPGNIHVDDPKAPPAYEIIGGQKYDVTPETKTQRELARTKQSILDAPLPNITKKGTEYYDPNTGTLIGFAPQQKQFGLLDLALMAATGGLLGSKAKTVAGLYSKGKFALDKAKQFSTLAETIGLTDKNVIDSFTDNFSGFGKGKSKETTSTNNNTNNGGKGEGDGIASLENQASGYDEYILLLQKLQSGNISDSERNRYNVLKNMLGI